MSMLLSFLARSMFERKRFASWIHWFVVLVITLSAGVASMQAFVSTQTGSSYYVATTGSDTNAGTLNSPFRTVQKCASVATAGAICFIRTGIYRETVTPANSGTAGAPITFKSYNNEAVTVSGADLVSGWTVHNHPSGKVYRTNMPWTLNSTERPAGNDQLFVNGVMMTEARWPNLKVAPSDVGREDLARADDAALLTANPAENQPATGRYTDAALNGSGANVWKDAKIYLLTGALWTPITGQVTESTNTSVTFTYPYGAGQYYALTKQDYYYLWGTYAALDAPREWFRGADGSLYLWMPNSDNPSNHLVEAKRREYVFNLRDRAYITIEGLNLFAGGISTTSNSTATVLDRVTARYLNHFQYVPYRWYGGGAGISLLGASSEVRNSDIAYSAGAGVAVQGTNSRAINNVVHSMAYMGVNNMVLSTRGDQIEAINNTVFNSGSQNVLDVRETSRGSVRLNDVFGAAKLPIDGGAVMITNNFDGQNMEIAYNLIHDNIAPSGGLYYGSTGIYSEGNTKNYLIHHNILWNNSTGLTLHPAPGNWHQNFKVYNNTIYGNVFINSSSDANYNMTGTVFQNNIFSKFQYGIRPHPDMVYTNNLTYEQSYANNPHATNPGFTDAVNGDFMPTAGSPLIDAGAVVSPYTDGYVGASPDIGALEYGKAPFVAGALLREQDLARLIATCRLEQSGTTASCSISNLPLGRKAPSNFQIRIGNASSVQNCVTKMNYSTVYGYTLCRQVPTGGQQNLPPANVRIGNGNWIQIPLLQQTVYLPLVQRGQ